jgi:hypothetical protein
MKRELFDDEETYELMCMQEQIDKLPAPTQKGTCKEPCHFPNCHCAGAPTRVGEPLDINQQLGFIKGMRLLVEKDPNATVIVDHQHTAILLAVEETLIASRLIQKALRHE